MSFLRALTRVVALFAVVMGANAADVYTFGVVPQASAVQAAKDWAPVLQALEQKTGLKFRFATTRDVASFSQRVNEEAWDFVYMSPDQYVDEERREDAYKPIARARNLKLKGIVVVRQNSTAEQLEDLDQQSLAVPANAFAADIIPQAVLHNEGVDFTSQTLATQDMVYRAVMAGQAAAGGGTTRSFNAALPEVRNQLRVLWTSEGYTAHAVTAHARVTPDVVQRVQEALIDLHLDAQGKKMLKTIAPEGLDYAKDEDWNELRDLGL